MSDGQKYGIKGIKTQKLITDNEVQKNLNEKRLWLIS